jgi:hypothetical protein
MNSDYLRVLPCISKILGLLCFQGKSTCFSIAPIVILLPRKPVIIQLNLIYRKKGLKYFSNSFSPVFLKLWSPLVIALRGILIVKEI